MAASHVAAFRAAAEPSLLAFKIALDPGHIGGSWAQMEERWFQVGDSQPIQEGDMTLLVAKLLAPKLRKLGAKVSLVRDKTAPVTTKRPNDLQDISKKILLRGGRHSRGKISRDPPTRRKSTPFAGKTNFCFIATAKSERAPQL